MPKDVIFEKTVRIKKPRVVGFFADSNSSPIVDMRTHTKLTPVTIVEKEDEFYFGDRWMQVCETRVGQEVGTCFIYRRLLEKPYA